MGEIKGNKNIPIDNSLNRTSLFSSWNSNEINSSIEGAIRCKGNTYSYELIGSRLDQKFDYPILGLVIKHWLNNRLKMTDVDEPVKVSLAEISNLFQKSHAENRRKNFKWLDTSLNRLCTAAIYLKIERNQRTIETDRAALLSSGRLYYGKGDDKYIEVEIGKILKKLYKNLDVTSLDVSFMNLELLSQPMSKNAKVLMRYLLTQRSDFRRFSLPLLLSLIEPIKPEKSQPSHGRDKVKKAILELQNNGFVTAFQTNEVVAWDNVTIITSLVTTDTFEAKQILNKGKSNYDQFAWKRKENRLADKENAPEPTPTLTDNTVEMDEDTKAILKDPWDNDDPSRF